MYVYVHCKKGGLVLDNCKNEKALGFEERSDEIKDSAEASVVH